MSDDARQAVSPPERAAEQVTTIELFFDLVFVFAITQLTSLFAHDMTPLGAVRVTVVLGVLWWIYGAYLWLTNLATPRSATDRMWLVLAMFGFMLIALATPHAFDRDGVWWGIGYLIVALIHGGMYAQRNRNMLRILPVNLAPGVLVIMASLTRGVWQDVLWIAALVTPIAATKIATPAGRFTIRPSHIVERYRLAVIITLGESVIAVGASVSAIEVTPIVVATIILGVALSATLWWAYFGGDDSAEVKAVRAVPAEGRVKVVLHGYFYLHVPIVVGVVILSAGIKVSAGRAEHALSLGPAAALAAGAALYLVGLAMFRRLLRIDVLRPRLVAALAALATLPLGWYLSADAQLVGLVGVFVILFLVEYRSSGRQHAARPALMGD